MKLLTHYSAKLDKSQNDEYLNAILYLDPSYNNEVCKGKSKGCFESCLVNSGRMGMKSAINARKNRTEYYFNNNSMFLMTLKGEIAALLHKAEKQGKKLAIRLNGTSDIDFTVVYNSFPTVTFYEYTKRMDLVKKLHNINNVHVTFSKHENHTLENVSYLVRKGINVAIVFENKPPETLVNIKVIDGDKHDRRFEDIKGAIIGLKLKGTNKVKSLAIASGFALQSAH